jgi:hypothetical protein
VNMMQRRNYIAALASIWLLSACQQQQDEPIAKGSETERPTALVLPVPEAPLDRQALLMAATRAASASALGETDTEAQRTLDGQRFELSLRFGCKGTTSAGDDDPRGWTFNEKRRVLSMRIDPGISGETPLIRSLGANTYEAVEGFWIRRPWLLSAACPISAPSAAEPPASAESDAASKTVSTAVPAAILPAPQIGIAQFFTATDARTHRRDARPYATSKVLEKNEEPSAVGYNIVISGRLRKLADGRVIACRSKSPSVPPSCIISAVFDSVAIEVPGSGAIIAKWSSS